MAYLIASHEFEESELGFQLYRALSLAVDDPVPWYELAADEQDYYNAAALDFIRFLQRSEGRLKKKRNQRLWIFDFDDYKAKCYWLYNDGKDPTEWVLRKGRDKLRFVLGQTTFKTKDDALMYGWNQLNGLKESTDTALTRLSRELQAYFDERETSSLDDMEYDRSTPDSDASQPEHGEEEYGDDAELSH